MQIHVVSAGDTLFQIASTYRTSTQAIIDANELDAPNNLVIGQALVIPIIGQFYFAQPGDSLFSIAQQFNIPLETLAQINGISPGNIIPVGFQLYIPPAPKTPITTNAYIEPSGDTVSETLKNSARKTAPYLTYLAIFSYRVGRDGSLTPPPLNGLTEIAEQNNVAKMLVVTNLEGGEFSPELGHIIVTVQSVQNTLLDNIINTATTQGYKDVHFDFEFLPSEDREAYNAFLRKAKERLSQAGLLMSTALAPKTRADQPGQWYEAHDYAVHGEVADFVVLMTYEWGYTYGPPLAVSPINEVRKVVDYALTVIPANKILLGQNLYGYDWTLPYAADNGKPAQAVSPQRAITIARENNAEIKFDQGAQAPFFTYTDEAGTRHEVWFEDARSIQAKFNLIKELGLLGISYWKLGLAFPQNWLLLQDQFTITKLE
ncbi:glycoside hydrolase family 18 protein [Virgibacillus sp. Bac330]|uniref:glycoside hydrolase family 18 protein n=1 Tax=Virgibacillus sp. Bac330 TaxID=2419841 RepID=UPI000EF4BA05|nr:glycoside hydrolase family 18 protein [Virgibacillus sp. Bac330]